MSMKKAKTLLMDIRHARRSINLRDQDPKEVQETLARILQEAVVLQTSDDGALGNAAIRELKQVRRSLVAQQVDAGSRNAEFIGKFSAVLDSVDNKDLAEDSDNELGLKNALDNMKNNLPSIDTITSAVMTANPLLGYGIKMFTDLTRGVRERRRRQSEERARGIEQALQESRLLEKEEEVAEERIHNAKEEAKERKARRGIYTPNFERLEEKLDRLSTEEPEDIQQVELVKNEEAEETNQLIREMVDTQNEQLELDKKREEHERLEKRESEFKGGVVATEGKGQFGKNNAGGRGGLLGGLGGIAGGGLIAGGMAALRPLLGIFRGLGGLAKSVGRIALRFGVVTTVIMSIVDFVDGFFNADKLLGKTDLNIGDRIYAGFLNIGAGLLSAILTPLNWLSEKLFNYSFPFETTQEAMFGYMNNLKEAVVDGAKNLFNDAISGVTGWFNRGVDMVKGAGEWSVEKYNDIVDRLTSFKEGVSDWFSSTINDIGGWFGSKFDSAKNFFGFDSKDEAEAERVVTEVAQDFLTSERRSTGNDRIDNEVVSIQERAMQEQARPINNQLTERSEVNDRSRGGSESGSNVVVAPNTVQNNVTNNTYGGARYHDNHEPTHRRIMNGYGRHVMAF